MAASSTIATAYISSKRISSPPARVGAGFSTSITFPTKARRVFVTYSTDMPIEATTEKAETETSVEAPLLPSSLISSLNVERALRGIPITDVDHYGRLGIQRGCSYDEVTVAYKSKIEELKNQELDDEEINSNLEKLKESYSILSSEVERRLYDWSLARTELPDKYVWPFEVEKAKPWKYSSPPQEPEDEGPTRLVGYFMLVWLVISFVLSIALNR
uniref:Chaperone DnaJ-domain superfamily protein n=1 Tax=Francoa sonchifolia TaxID=23250 RepID=A0A0F7H179_9ROSI